jgi:cell division protein FtsL
MTEKQIFFLAAATFLLTFLVVIFRSLRFQKNAVDAQDAAFAKVDESIQLQREALRIAEESLSTLRETNRLLETLAKKEGNR